jgi:hypothetical protein
MILRALLLSLVFWPGLVLADAFQTPPLKTGSAVSVQGYGRQNPRCAEWTNGCVICVGPGGHAQCSTPGIACTPAGLTCKRHVLP